MNNSIDIGIHVPTILLPNEKVDLTKWCVVACDQYTSQPEYWDEVEKKVGDNPSTLRLVYPEIYLEEKNPGERIQKIVKNMNHYLEAKILTPQLAGFIYVDRKTSHVPSRKGLIVALDLEHYDYNEGSQTLIRATEGTVLERIPPRVKIRENASIESPHIMVLIDDPEKTVIEPIAKKTDQLRKLYDTDLMMDGGRIQGYAVDDKEMISDIINSICKLAEPETFYNKYNIDRDKNILLFAVGDGNHSLATAKACWENIKPSLSAAEIADHPARFALVELVNVHDEGLVFEPIHRVIFNVEPDKVLKSMLAYYQEQGCQASYTLHNSQEELVSQLENLKKEEKLHVIPFIMEGNQGILTVENPKHNLEVGTLQSFLDDYLNINTNMKIDYIHGEDVVKDLASKANNMGFLLPSMNKHDLFKTVILDGVLPRKTFSMGEAEEKRFYLECRKIIKD